MDALWAMFLAVTSTGWLAAGVIVGVAVVGGMVHILVRSGRDGQRLNSLERDVGDVKEDVRDLYRITRGQPSPSERREQVAHQSGNGGQHLARG